MTVGPVALNHEDDDPRPVSSETSGQRLLVAMPANNEARTIGDVIRAIPKDVPGIGSVEVVVVDDGSADATSSIAEELGAVVLRHSVQQGVGAAFHTALAHAIEGAYDSLVTIDSDGQFNPSDIPALVYPVVAGEADFATASRFADPGLTPRMPRLKRWGNFMMSRLISSLVRQRFYDVSCGMRCYSRAAALRLHLIGHFTYTQEVFLNLAFKKMRLVEVPIRVRGERQYGKSRVASNLWRYALRSSQIILRCYRDYYPLRFFGALSLLLVLGSAALGGFFGLHFLRTGSMSPHLWAALSSAGLFFLACLSFQVGLFGDILNRHRIYLEEILYHQRRGSQQPDPSWRRRSS